MRKYRINMGTQNQDIQQQLSYKRFTSSYGCEEIYLVITSTTGLTFDQSMIQIEKEYNSAQEQHLSF